MSANNGRLFAAVCTNPDCGHKAAYDKDEVCSQAHTVMQPDKEYYVTCPACKKRFKVELDCEGYR